MPLSIYYLDEGHTAKISQSVASGISNFFSSGFKTPRNVEQNISELDDIIQEIQSNLTITSIDFSGVKLNPEGIVKLAGFLKINSIITEVILNNTKAAYDTKPREGGGIEALVEALKYNKNLQKLSLNNNFLDDIHADMLIEALKGSSNITVLQLDGNKISDNKCEEIQKIIQENIDNKNHINDLEQPRRLEESEIPVLLNSDNNKKSNSINLSTMTL